MSELQHCICYPYRYISITAHVYASSALSCCQQGGNVLRAGAATAALYVYVLSASCSASA